MFLRLHPFFLCCPFKCAVFFAPDWLVLFPVPCLGRYNGRYVLCRPLVPPPKVLLCSYTFVTFKPNSCVGAPKTQARTRIRHSQSRIAADPGTMPDGRIRAGPTSTPICSDSSSVSLLRRRTLPVFHVLEQLDWFQLLTYNFYYLYRPDALETIF